MQKMMVKQKPLSFEDKIEKIKKYFDNEMNNILKKLLQHQPQKKNKRLFKFIKKYLIKFNK